MQTGRLYLPLALVLCGSLTAQRLIGFDSDRSVWEIDIATGARTQIGTISANAGVPGAAAYDQATGRLFVASTSLDELYTVDVTSWNATRVGSFGLSLPYMHGLEWDPTSQTLYGYGASLTTGGLFTIDTSTGTATFIGSTGIGSGGTGTSAHALGFDPIQNVMWMTNRSTDSFYSIDRATGAATLVGPLNGPTGPNGLAYNIDNLTLYLVDNHTDVLYAIDTATGAATAVGSMGTSNMLGLVYIPGSGRLTRGVHGCGPTTIRVTAHPVVGAPVETVVGSVTGIPFVGYGLANLGVPFCGCTIGHDWAVAVVGAGSTFPLPPNPALVGVQLRIQGADLLGVGGCANPLLTLTDTITVTIG